MSSIFSTFLFVHIVLSAQANSYKILVIPLSLKSHIFSLAIIADGLASRGHDVSFFVSENVGLHEAEATLKSWPEVTVIRYKDSLDGFPMIDDGIIDKITTMVMQTQGNLITIAPILRKR